MRTALKFREGKRDSSSLVYVLHKTCNQTFSLRSRESTVKKCTKKRDARAKLLFCVINLLLFLTSWLPSPSPSSLLKLPATTTATATRKQYGFNFIMQDNLQDINFAGTSLIYIHFFTVLARLHREDGDGNEKVTFKMN